MTTVQILREFSSSSCSLLCVIQQYVILQYVILQYVILQYVILQYVILQYVILQYVILQYVILQYVILQYVILQYCHRCLCVIQQGSLSRSSGGRRQLITAIRQSHNKLWSEYPVVSTAKLTQPHLQGLFYLLASWKPNN
ncbi:hypothetical protein ACOMHN_059099 [Nucella lapillus]